MIWLKNIAKYILDDELDVYEKRIKELEDKNEELIEQIDKNKKSEVMEDYYNNKYPKSNICYKRIDKFGTTKIDLRQFLNKNDYSLTTFKTETDDEKALACLNWIINNITYTSDSTQYKESEYWAFGYETLASRKGDCEDGAILLYNLMRFNGIPAWKIRLSAGWVINPNTKKKEGHAYLTYYYEEGSRWVVLDWCYLPNTADISSRKDYKDEKIYSDVWFSWNEDYSWTNGLNTEASNLLNTGTRRKK